MTENGRYPAVSPFTWAFATALRAVMTRHDVSQTAVAEAIGRTQGFVSERTNGKRPCDTDIITGIAMVAGVDPKTIISEVVREMRSSTSQPVDLTKRTGIWPERKPPQTDELQQRRARSTTPQPKKTAARTARPKKGDDNR